MFNFRNFMKCLNQNKAKIVGITLALLIIIIFVTCYDKWNEIWYEFGKNLYYLFNEK